MTQWRPVRTESFGRTATAGVLSKPRLELRIGSNIFRSTNGVVKIHGKEQLVIEVKPDPGLLLATLDLYNERGVRIAHLRRNVLTLNDNERFTIDDPLGQRLSSVDSPSILGDRSAVGASRFRSTHGIRAQSRYHLRKVVLAQGNAGRDHSPLLPDRLRHGAVRKHRGSTRRTGHPRLIQFVFHPFFDS